MEVAHPESYGHWDHAQISELLNSRDWFAKQYADSQRWRKDLADQLAECEKHRDALGRALQRRENDLMLLRNAVEQMMAPLGYHGEISARDDRVQCVMDALAKIDSQESRNEPQA